MEVLTEELLWELFVRCPSLGVTCTSMARSLDRWKRSAAHVVRYLLCRNCATFDDVSAHPLYMRFRPRSDIVRMMYPLKKTADVFDAICRPDRAPMDFVVAMLTVGILEKLDPTTVDFGMLILRACRAGADPTVVRWMLEHASSAAGVVKEECLYVACSKFDFDVVEEISDFMLSSSASASASASSAKTQTPCLSDIFCFLVRSAHRTREADFMLSSMSSSAKTHTPCLSDIFCFLVRSAHRTREAAAILRMLLSKFQGARCNVDLTMAICGCGSVINQNTVAAVGSLLHSMDFLSLDTALKGVMAKTINFDRPSVESIMLMLLSRGADPIPAMRSMAAYPSRMRIAMNYVRGFTSATAGFILANLVRNDSTGRMVGEFLRHVDSDVVKHRCRGRKTVLMMCKTIGCARELLAHGADLRATDCLGRTVLMHACSTNVSLEYIEFLLDQDLGTSGINALSSNKCTCALLRACFTLNGPDVVALLLDRGADPNIVFGDGSSILTNVCRSWLIPCDAIKLLVERGANVDHRDRNTGWSAMHNIVYSGHRKQYSVLLTCLVAAGADVNIRDNAGDTPLHFACKRAKLEAIVFLVRHGADPDLLNDLGESPRLNMTARVQWYMDELDCTEDRDAIARVLF